MAAKRNYAKETKWESSPEQVKNRVARNKARRVALAAGKVHKGDKMEVDHIKPLAIGGSNALSNQRVISRHANRASAAAVRVAKARRG